MTRGVRRRAPLVGLGLVLLAELPALVPPPFPLTDHLVFWEAGRIVASGGPELADTLESGGYDGLARELGVETLAVPPTDEPDDPFADPGF